jgi:hypothetical protein
MSDSFKIENVPYYTQRDNATAPYVSCFPTSVAMAMAYCLQSIGKTKADIGCSDKMQLEDYINQVLDSTELDIWTKSQVKVLGSWILGTPKRQILATETYVFNLLMNKLGFTAEAHTDLTYNGVCDWIETNKLPAVISGVFTSVSKVGGHMNCITGFSKIGIHEFIVNDPYGYALSGYTKFSPEDSTGVHYGEKFYTKDSKGSLWVMLIKQS